MPIGEFYARNCESGTEFEVVLLDPDEQHLCKRLLRERNVTVSDDAMLGHFTIHLDDPQQWAEVGEVVFGEIHPLASEAAPAPGTRT